MRSADAAQLLPRATDRPPSVICRPMLVAALQTGDAHHVELVEVAREDREELHPLQQRLAAVLGQREHAGVEGEPRQLTVAEPVRG